MTTERKPLEDACKWCGAPIYWLMYPKTGKWAPVDHEPAIPPKGNIIVNLDEQSYSIVGKPAMRDSMREADASQVFHENHWVTCPNAKDHADEKKLTATAAAAKKLCEKCRAPIAMPFLAAGQPELCDGCKEVG